MDMSLFFVLCRLLFAMLVTIEARPRERISVVNEDCPRRSSWPGGHGDYPLGSRKQGEIIERSHDMYLYCIEACQNSPGTMQFWYDVENSLSWGIRVMQNQANFTASRIHGTTIILHASSL